MTDICCVTCKFYINEVDLGDTNGFSFDGLCSKMDILIVDEYEDLNCDFYLTK